jgi:hypothetical protein
MKDVEHRLVKDAALTSGVAAADCLGRRGELLAKNTVRCPRRRGHQLAV